MPRQWYGKAHSARQAPRSANAARTLRAVGGANSRTSTSVTMDPRGCRAVYGSTDRATLDHSNAALCKVLTIAKAQGLHEQRHYSGTEYGRAVYRLAASGNQSSAEEWTTPGTDTLSADDAAWIVRRAEARNMSLVVYAATMGLTIN